VVNIKQVFCERRRFSLETLYLQCCILNVHKIGNILYISIPKLSFLLICSAVHMSKISHKSDVFAPL